jgi:hypothetical protein
MMVNTNAREWWKGRKGGGIAAFFENNKSVNWRVERSVIRLIIGVQYGIRKGSLLGL